MIIFPFFFFPEGAVVIEVCGRSKAREMQIFLGGGTESTDHCEICLGCGERRGAFRLSCWLHRCQSRGGWLGLNLSRSAALPQRPRAELSPLLQPAQVHACGLTSMPCGSL